MREINLLEGNVVAPEGITVGIVASRFNEIIVNKLLGGAVDGLVRHGVEESNITAAWVPGAFEIPVIAKAMAISGKYDAVICLGCVSGVPVMFGLVTTENIDQAIARAGSKAGNKGYDCALGAIEMINLRKLM